jgi:hypothetical protein
MESDPVLVTYEAACRAAFDELSASGADLSKPIELAFYLYFAERKYAELLVECIQDEGFRAEVHQRLRHLKNAADERWTVILRLKHEPEREFIDSVIARLEYFATKCLGEFDGWEAKMPS